LRGRYGPLAVSCPSTLVDRGTPAFYAFFRGCSVDQNFTVWGRSRFRLPRFTLSQAARRTFMFPSCAPALRRSELTLLAALEARVFAGPRLLKLTPAPDGGRKEP
jgi:hypothetical protein